MGKELKDVNQKSSTANNAVLKRIGGGARVIEITKDVAGNDEKDGKTSELPGDPFLALLKEGTVIEPPFDMLTLAMLPEHNTEMGQCIEAMEVNIEGFGHRFIPRVRKDGDSELSKELQESVKNEKVELENFFAYCTKESFVKFRRKLRKDLETTGCGYFEVVRNSSGKIQSFTHLPSYQMRLGRVEEKLVENERPILELQNDGSIKIVKVKEFKRFRTFVQAISFKRGNINSTSSNKMMWFKEFGDTRTYDKTTGKLASDNLAEDKKANEVVYFDIYSTRSPYGLPRYIGNLFSIFGDRASEEINFITFKNNNIPSMVVCVSNGALTQGSIDRVQTFVESQIQGSDNYSKFLILEAEGEEEGDEGGQVKIDVKPLVSEQHTDALFQNYSKGNQDKIRRVWRLPPIFLGGSDDYTRSTAETSRRLADEQIFAPERDDFDEFMNRIMFPEMGIVYHKFKSNSPNTTDNTELVKILMGSEKTGGMTPTIARLLLEDILGRELPDFKEGEFDPDKPFSLTMAEAVKKQSDPTEPNQLRSLDANEKKEDNLKKEEASDADVAKAIIGLHQIVEKRWWS
jgi:PBSX family phage portal protein